MLLSRKVKNPQSVSKKRHSNRLILKGFLKKGGSEGCPALKGIKTRLVVGYLRADRSEGCPALKGIKTLLKRHGFARAVRLKDAPL